MSTLYRAWVYFKMFIGYNRTGKSMTAQKFANEWRINNPDRTIAGYDPQNKFKHLINPKYRLYAGEKGWWKGTGDYKKSGRLPLKDLRNALVIIDDMRGLNPSHQTSPDLLRLMEFRAEYKIDIIMILHSPGHLLEGISMYVSHWYIFVTKGKAAKFEDKIENYEECQLAARLMREYNKDFPGVINNSRQFYDASGNGNHTFPHIVVDTDTGELKPRHINRAWAETKLKKLLNDSEK